MQHLYLYLLIQQTKTHHASQRNKRRLDLSHVAVLKKVVGLEDVERLETVGRDRLDEVRQVLQLQKERTTLVVDAILLQ